jgi:hypothetical protein
MYFASEPCKVSAVCAALLETVREQPGLTWLALIDGAFDHGQAGLSLPNERHALYDCDGLSDLLAASPYLITLTAHDEDRLQLELTTLLRHRKERPMLSFIGTSSSPLSVNENFRLFANAVTDDDQEFLLRFADTRVLSGISSALRQAYWDGMTCLFSDWIVIDREGKLRELPLCASRGLFKGKFQLSPAEFGVLVTNSEPDVVIDAIAENNPEAFPDVPRATIYDKVAMACSFAHKHDVRAFPDLVALAYLALLNNGEGLENPKLREILLGSQWKSGSLINDLADFVD